MTAIGLHQATKQFTFQPTIGGGACRSSASGVGKSTLPESMALDDLTGSKCC
jgi:hypothetical protein